jgi:hypothetical protein
MATTLISPGGLTQEPVCRKGYGGGWVGVLDLLKKHCERQENG